MASFNNNLCESQGTEDQHGHDFEDNSVLRMLSCRLIIFTHVCIIILYCVKPINQLRKGDTHDKEIGSCRPLNFHTVGLHIYNFTARARVLMVTTRYIFVFFLL